MGQKMLRLILIISTVFLFSCSNEESTNEDENENGDSLNIELSLVSKSINLESNINKTKYLIKIESQNNNLNINSVSTSDIKIGYIYGLSTNDQIIPIVENLDNGSFDYIHSEKDKTLYMGDVIVDGVNCLVIMQSGDESNCIIIKQEKISSASAGFSSGKTYIYISLVDDNQKQLYSYSKGIYTLIDNYTGQKDKIVTGKIIRSYTTNDLTAFIVDDEEVKKVVLFKNNEDLYDVRVDDLTSEVIDIDGELYFFSGGTYRSGPSRQVPYSGGLEGVMDDSSVIVSINDAKFLFFYSPNLTEHGINNPSIFYMQYKGTPLEDSSPEYDFVKIGCCKARNNPEGTRDKVEEISWKKVRGYKQYILAYGEVVDSSYNDYDPSNIIIEKAIILIDGNQYYNGPTLSWMSEVYLYDYNNTSSYEDNLINALGYDTISIIENYKNGFKITGIKNSMEKIVYYNPFSSTIETPNTLDTQSFIIKERL